jgi:hypothetical protein
MDKNHKDKINTAIGLCEKRFSQFCSAVEARYSKEEAAEIKYFLLQNTVFAGGVFRSIFTEMPVKDVDVFFTSLDASLEFQDRFMKPAVYNKSLKPLFLAADISKYNTFNWYGTSRKDPPLSFITKNAAEPLTLINQFDFSFNQHYFDLNSYTMGFDVDTFSKIGQHNYQCKSWHDNIYIIKRALKFMQQGFKIDTTSLMTLVGEIAGRITEEDLMNDGSGGPTLDELLEITSRRYTQDDYFGISSLQVAEVATAANPNRYPDWWIQFNPATNNYELQLPNGHIFMARTVEEVVNERDARQNPNRNHIFGANQAPTAVRDINVEIDEWAAGIGPQYVTTTPRR